MPSDLDEVLDFGDYFVSLRKWFFGGVILLIVVDFVDSAVKGWGNVVDLGFGYASLRTFLLIGAVGAMRSVGRAYHGIYALIGLVWTFLFFWLNRPVIVIG